LRETRDRLANGNPVCSIPVGDGRDGVCGAAKVPVT